MAGSLLYALALLALYAVLAGVLERRRLFVRL